jgi:multidrug efflux pump subunit AcrA (membrane-fusion protein)
MPLPPYAPPTPAAAPPAAAQPALAAVTQVPAPAHGPVQPPTHPPAAPPPPTTGWLLETLAVVLQAPAARHGVARALVAHLAATARCQRVALAWADGTAGTTPAAAFAGTGGSDLAVLAVSDLPPLPEARTTSAEALRDLQAAMQECAAAASTLCLPMNDATARHPLLAHVQMVRATGAAAVCSVPLGTSSSAGAGAGAGRRGASGHAVKAGNASQICGVITLQRDAAEPFTPQEVRRLEQLALFLAPLLQLRDVARRTTTSADPHTPRWWQQLRQRGRQAAPLILAAALLLVGALPVDHAVVAPARVHGLTEQHLTAPRDGFIASVHARPGDTVAAGQTLVALDEEGPRNDLKAAQAALEQAESAFGEALARGEQSQVVTQVAKADEARARVAMLQDELQRGQLQAPAAGSVVQGDLSRSIGAPVKRGDTLMVVTAAQGFRLSLWVDERDVHQVQVGQTGSLRLATQPGVVHSLQVQRVTPVASVREGHNGFEVDAQLVPNGDVTGTKVGGAVQTSVAANAAVLKPGSNSEVAVLKPGSNLETAMLKPGSNLETAVLKPGFEGIARLDAGPAPLAWVLGQRVWQWLQLGWWSWWG